MRSGPSLAEAEGACPASGEGKLVLTTAPWSQTAATGIPEGFHSGLPWRGCRERREDGEERMPTLALFSTVDAPNV